MDASDSSCSNRFFCEATQEASKFGKIGVAFAKVARYSLYRIEKLTFKNFVFYFTIHSSNAQSWLESINPSLHGGIEEAGLFGIIGSCETQFPCNKKPSPYK